MHEQLFSSRRFIFWEVWSALKVKAFVIFEEIIVVTSLFGIILKMKRVVAVSLITFVPCYFGFFMFGTSRVLALTDINAKVAVILI